MKKFHFSILICVVLCAVLALVLVGCNDNALSRPAGLKLDGPTLTLSWKVNTDAVYYVVNISGNGVNEDKNTRKNSFSLANLGLAEGNYNLKVKACGDGKTFKDSAWSEPLSFSQDADSGLTFAFIKNNSEAEVVSLGRASGNVIIPDTYRGIPVTSIGEKAFSGKSKLTGIVMGNNITNIGASAFYNCTFLKTVTLSQNLTTIGDKAFQSCKVLEGVLKIPQNVTSIGNSSFAYCSEITGVELNNNLVTIGENGFAYCSKLKSVSIPDSVESIGNSAFFSCKELSSLRFGKGVEKIGEYAFASCDSLINVELNKGLKTIDKYAFASCANLDTVIFSSTVEIIGDGAFYLSDKLANVTLNQGLKRIGQGAFLNTALWNNSQNDVYLCNWFLGCKDTEIGNISLKNDTIGIANYAFEGFKNIVQVILPDSVKIIGDQAFAASEISAVVIGSGAEEIGTQAFYKCAKLANVILGSYDFSTGKMIASSLKVINEYAFMGCTQLQNIEIPSTVETISTYAFNDSALYKNAENGVAYAGNWIVGCDNTKANGTIIIDNGTVGIANYAFYKCTNISGVKIPDSVKTIGRSAFYQCTNLASVTLPSELEIIADYTFYGCTKLVVPTLPQTLKSIGRSAFYKCALANSSGTDTDNDVLTIPDSVETIGDFAFFGCGYKSVDMENMSMLTCGIDVVMIGNGVKYIGNNAFNTFSSLKKVVFGDSVLTMGAKAFYKCELLADVQLNSGLQNIGERAFYGCNKLTEITVPDGVITIDNYAFYRCAELVSVNFGANVQNIGNYAFYGCLKLAGVVLPDKLASMGKQAFRACVSLESIVLNDSITSMGAHVFYGCPSLTIYARNNSAQSGWDTRFNSSYRPVVWGCTVRDGYVYSVTKAANTISNLNTTNTLTAPYRAGYTFAGWSTTQGANTASVALGDLSGVKDGTTLYTVWSKNNSEN